MVAIYEPAPRLRNAHSRASTEVGRVDSPMSQASRDDSPKLAFRNHATTQYPFISAGPYYTSKVYANGNNLKASVSGVREVVSQGRTRDGNDLAGEEPSVNESTDSSSTSENDMFANKHVVPHPTHALVRQKDQVVYKAAWYHALLPNSQQTSYISGWRNHCKMDWNRSFWQLAQHDDTLLEMFLSFAAAKEAAMTGAKSSRGYYLHKGRALTLIRRDITREGRQLRIPAIAAICLLCMAAFVEGEYQAAEMHLRAIAPLVSSRMLSGDSLPPFLWLLLTWADLRLTAVDSRPPMLPYALHPDFDIRLPPFLEMRTTAMAKWNVDNLPRSDVFQTEQALDLLENLYAYTEIHNQQSIDWKVAWSVSYQTAFSLAKLQDALESSRFSGEEPENNDEPGNSDMVRAFILAARILFWFTMNKFVSQGGLHPHLITQLTALLTKQMPAELCFQWSRHASLDVLLWILFAIYLSFDGVRATLSASELAWLQASMKMVVMRLKLHSYDEFVGRLRRLPFAYTWVNLTCTAFAWLDGSPLVTDHDPNPSSLFSLIRLNFDPMKELDRMDGHHSLKQIDNILDAGEQRCTACREKVLLSSEELFHFAFLKREACAKLRNSATPPET